MRRIALFSCRVHSDPVLQVVIYACHPHRVQGLWKSPAISVTPLHHPPLQPPDFCPNDSTQKRVRMFVLPTVREQSPGERSTNPSSLGTAKCHCVSSSLFCDLPTSLWLGTIPSFSLDDIKQHGHVVAQLLRRSHASG